jgi:hypothetical protein
MDVAIVGIALTCVVILGVLFSEIYHFHTRYEYNVF